MPQLHQLGVDVLVDLLDAADNLDTMRQHEVKALVRQTAEVLGELLKRDVPDRPAGKNLRMLCDDPRTVDQ